MARRTTQEDKEAAGALTYSYNHMECVDATGKPIGKMKMFCPGCGLPRDPELTARAGCSACGTPAGTELLKRPPIFDDDGERLEGEAATAYRKAQREAAARRTPRGEEEAPAERAPDAADAIAENFPTSDAAKAIKLSRQQPIKPAAAPATPRIGTSRPNLQTAPKPQASSLADLFL